MSKLCLCKTKFKKSTLSSTALVIFSVLGFIFTPAVVAASDPEHGNGKVLPADPLESVMWSYMADQFFNDGEIIFDSRVIVDTPYNAEDQFYVPVTVDATALEDDGHEIEEIVALADLNPIPRILTLKPTNALPFVGFRVKLQQSTPIRVGVKTSDGKWHINGAWVDAAGGGCTAPAAAHGNANWMKTLGLTRAVARRESPLFTRVSLRMRHPMDTGLAHGIPVFYMSDIDVKLPDGTPLAELQLFEPVSENPTLTLKPRVATEHDSLDVLARDTEGHEFRFQLSVPSDVSN